MSGEAAARIAGELGLAAGRRRLVCCCRLIDVKRVDMVIDAFGAIAAERPEWDLVIVGEGPLRAGLEERARAAAAGRVQFLGFLDQERVTGVYRSSDALVLASAYEPWALVVNEAAAAGCAIVASDLVGAAPELVREGENGFVFAAGDLGALTERLRAVTEAGTIENLKRGSRAVVAEWRRRADPIAGLRSALASAGVLKA
jgi:glycosyltransferase involved in cell wall biosynthesis